MKNATDAGLRLGIVGGNGWIGGAIARAALAAGLLPPEGLALSPRSHGRRRRRARARGARHRHGERGLELAADRQPAARSVLRAHRKDDDRSRVGSPDEPRRDGERQLRQGLGNAMILGRAGLEGRHDVWLDVSPLAPQVRYTDHAYAPEET